ncbi:MAG: HEPN domain-containing protein [Geobacteraceae bacterium]|jgi:HEPN domain-containing protein
MVISKQTEEWLKQAEYDLETAEAMLRSRRFIYAVFMCHHCLEKALKGLLAGQGQIPVKSHDLVFLLERIGTEVPELHAEFLEMLNEVSVPTRYPEELDRLMAQYPRKRTAEIVGRCREVYTWLKNCL